MDIDTLAKQIFPATVVAPELIQLSKNIEIIPNISDAVESVGILTHEGIFGPLLFAESSRAFFIELKPGMFLSEHPHPTGWEAPFPEGAFLLVFKTKEEGAAFEPYMQGLKDMLTMLDHERKGGMQFYFNELAPDHEANQFARSVNPYFDEVLNNIPY